MEDSHAHPAGPFSADLPEMISTRNTGESDRNKHIILVSNGVTSVTYLDAVRRGNVILVQTPGPGVTASCADLTNV